MSRVKRALDGRDAHIFTLRMIILILAATVAYAMHGWNSAPSRIKVDIPPDLRTGSSRGIEDRHPYNVYAFSLYMWQQLNNWPLSGRENYKSNIDRFACYLTPAFKVQLERDYELKAKRSELTRTRHLQEMLDRPYKDKRVWIESGDSWVTYLDTSVKETYQGQVVKDIYVRYPIRISRWDVDGECNPWGLALNGFYDEPKRLEGSEHFNDTLAAN